jgi:ribosomal protein S18 acetylase RimI-like enzyme
MTNPPDTIRIRRAVAADAQALAGLAESTFRETFAASNSADDMARHCAASFGPSIQAAEIRDPRIVTLLAEHAGELAGFAQLRLDQAKAGVAAAHPSELHRIYVAAAHHGSGVARRLLDTVLEEARRAGSDYVWLGVWERNPRAMAFYRKAGFMEIGEHEFVLGSDRQRDVVMGLPIAR